MDMVKLHYPVHALDGELLLPAGTVLSDETLKELIASGRTKACAAYPLLDYGMVRHDLLRQISRPPYDVIFSGGAKVAEVVATLEKIRFVLPVLRSLDYFKKDDYHTYCHSLVVFALSVLVARDLLPDDREWENFVSIGPTHDIGKLCVPLDLLKKEGPLTKTERMMINHHTTGGYVLLSYYHGDHGNCAAIVARDHHEMKDASGMPRGIRLMDLMVEITVVCDVYDALISPRPYRPFSYDNRTALEELTSMAEKKKVNWEALRSLVAHNRRAKPEHWRIKVSREKRGRPPLLNLYGVVEDGL